MAHSASLEPDEVPYCELCCEFQDECTCEIGYEEER